MNNLKLPSDCEDCQDSLDFPNQKTVFLAEKYTVNLVLVRILLEDKRETGYSKLVQYPANPRWVSSYRGGAMQDLRSQIIRSFIPHRKAI